MNDHNHETVKFFHLRRQRNLYGALTVVVLFSIGMTMPRRLRSYRALKIANTRLTDLQATIVDTRVKIKNVELEILKIQRQIKDGQS
jgi:hypothetical protein